MSGNRQQSRRRSNRPVNSGAVGFRSRPAQFGGESAERRAAEAEAGLGRLGEVAHDSEAESVAIPRLVDPDAALGRPGDGLFGHARAVVLDGKNDIFAVAPPRDADLAPGLARRLLRSEERRVGKAWGRTCKS